MRKFKIGDKVLVLNGCVWVKAEIEDLHSDDKYYVCGNHKWSTVYHAQDIKPREIINQDKQLIK